MKTRILVAIPVIVLVVLAIFLQGWLLALFAVLISCFCAWETTMALDRNAHPVVKSVTIGTAVALALLFLMEVGLRQNPANSASLLNGETVFIIYALALIAAFILVMFSRNGSFGMLENTVLVMLYPQMLTLFLYLLILRLSLGGRIGYLQTMIGMLFVFVPPSFSDTLAYFWGRRFGKRHLWPAISPKKTLAGSVAGLVGGGLGSALIYVLACLVVPAGSVVAGSLTFYICSGVLLALLSQMGDLAASFIKRAMSIKDFGHLLPGHGGVMDRVDSTIFTLPFVWLLAAGGALGFS